MPSYVSIILPPPAGNVKIDAEIPGLGPLGEGQAVAAERCDVAEDGLADQVAERFERGALDHFGPGWQHKL